MKTPLVLIIYNRYDCTLQLIKSINNINPEKLFVIADGPKENEKNDTVKCDRVRSLIDNIGSKTKIEKIYSSKNIGLESRVVSGLNDVFSIVDRAIILEDDCIPDAAFFEYCTELLDKYEDCKDVVHIAGSKYVTNDIQNQSYYFSKYSLEWGWATWKNRWLRYDGTMKDWPRIKKDKTFREIIKDKKVYKYWQWIFENCYNGHINSWAYKWLYKNMIEKKYTIIPKYNLINNIGIGTNSTNTKFKNTNTTQPLVQIAFPLKHPSEILFKEEFDSIQEQALYNKSVLWLELITKRLKPLISRLKI